MRTQCPECHSPIAVEVPTIDPASPMSCRSCRSEVRPGAFLCPGCRVGLQVERQLLPEAGGRGRCPQCAMLIDVPPLEAVLSPVLAMASAPDTVSPASMTTQRMDPSATQRIDLSALAAEAPADPGASTNTLSLDSLRAQLSAQEEATPAAPLPFDAEPPSESFSTGEWPEVDPVPEPESVALAGEPQEAAFGLEPEAPSASGPLDLSAGTFGAEAAVGADRFDAAPSDRGFPAEPERPIGVAPTPRSRINPVARRPAPEPPAARSGRGTGLLLGLLLGGLLAAGAGFGAASLGYWSPPRSPLPALSDLAAGLAILGTAGGLVGAILGGLLLGRR